VKYTWLGDTDLNGQIDFDDYTFLDFGFNTGGSDWFHGDFDYNGQVDFDDYIWIDLGFNTQNGTLRRALAYLSGEDRNVSSMDDAALLKVVEHSARFGAGYASHFLAAAPEPSVAAVVMILLAPGLSATRFGTRRAGS
jgi:hypothetical protein